MAEYTSIRLKKHPSNKSLKTMPSNFSCQFISIQTKPWTKTGQGVFSACVNMCASVLFVFFSCILFLISMHIYSFHCMLYPVAFQGDILCF